MQARPFLVAYVMSPQNSFLAAKSSLFPFHSFPSLELTVVGSPLAIVQEAEKEKSVSNIFRKII